MERKSSAIRCIIFDFDGTIADTEHFAFHISNELAERYNFKKITREDLIEMKKMHFKEIMEFIEVSARQLPFILRRGQKLLRRNMHEVQFCEEHFPEFLSDLGKRELILGIITSNTKKNVLRFLKHKNIEIFEFVLAASLFNKQSKVKHIMKKYKLAPEEILYVGDEVRDIHSARASGVHIASVVWGYNDRQFLEAEEPDWLLEDSREILEILDGEK